MPVDRKPIFAAVKHLRGDIAWDQRSVDILDRAIDTATGETTERFKEPEPPKQRFSFGRVSLEQLSDVHPKLRACAELAITLTLVDFRVRGRRTPAEQAQKVAEGTSRTLHSKHLLQPDGTIWAIDCEAVVNGQVVWEPFNLYAAIAFAMDQAATRLGIAQHIRWGCAWDRVLSDFGGSPQAYMDEAKAYADRHPGKDLIDGPHFEWVP